MTVFSKSDFKGIDYLTFDPNFEINDCNQIIFAFNGIGKTSLVTYLNKTHGTEYDFLSDDESQAKIFKKNGTQCTIAPYVEEIQSIKDKLAELEENFEPIEWAERNSIKIKEAKEIDPDLATALKEGINYKYEDVSAEQMNSLNKLIGPDDSKVLIGLKDKIDCINNLEQEIHDCTDSYLLSVFEDMKGHYDSKTTICPVCGSKNVKLEQTINAKKKSLENIADSTFFVFSNYKKESDSQKQMDFVNGIVNVVKNMTKGQILSSVVSSFNFSNFKQIKANYDDYQSLNKQLLSLKEKQKEFYEGMSENKEFVEKNFPNEYPNSKIKFDDKKESVSISLPRNVKEYSTGELHNLFLIIKTLSFKGSSKKKLVIDDPLSSYDFINQYRIIYRLASLIKDTSKTLLIFTHNIDTINIANTQSCNLFKYYYIEKSKSALSIYEMNLDKNMNSFLSLNSLCNTTDEYISLLCKRSFEGKCYKGNKVFHYDSPFRFLFSIKGGNNKDEKIELSNDSLASFIDDFKVIDNHDFQKNTEEKIHCLFAIRVWIEKQLFLVAKKIKDYDYIKKQESKTTKDKIEIMEKDSKLASNFPSFNKKEFLMKKVMLNQNSHIQSQIIPFNFAMNISLDDVSSEIENIKKLFIRKDENVVS